MAHWSQGRSRSGLGFVLPREGDRFIRATRAVPGEAANTSSSGRRPKVSRHRRSRSLLAHPAANGPGSPGPSAGSQLGTPPRFDR